MIKKVLSEKGWEDFIEKHSDNITEVRKDRIYLHCIVPGHNDTNRSAVLYKSGIYACPVCGTSRLNLNTELVEVKIKETSSKSYFFNTESFPLHYYKLGDIIGACNVKDGKIVGLTTRVPFGKYRRYLCTGEPGFRLFAPVITESLTDAITLLELGINAGSICSVANWKLIPQNAIYVPQADKAGMDVVWKLKDTVIFKWFWKLPGYKDISEIDPALLDLLVEPLRPNYELGYSSYQASYKR